LSQPAPLSESYRAVIADLRRRAQIILEAITMLENLQAEHEAKEQKARPP